MKVTVTKWGDGYENSGVDTDVVRDSGESTSVGFSDGEPEDMCIARDLSSAKDIWKMVKMAYEAGKDGEDIEIVHIEKEEE